MNEEKKEENMESEHTPASTASKLFLLQVEKQTRNVSACTYERGLSRW